MKIVIKFTKGKLKGYNIRQLKNEKFVLYRGNISHSEIEFKLFDLDKDFLKHTT